MTKRNLIFHAPRDARRRKPRRRISFVGRTPCENDYHIADDEQSVNAVVSRDKTTTTRVMEIKFHVPFFGFFFLRSVEPYKTVQNLKPYETVQNGRGSPSSLGILTRTARSAVVIYQTATATTHTTIIIIIDPLVNDYTIRAALFEYTRRVIRHKRPCQYRRRHRRLARGRAGVRARVHEPVRFAWFA